MCFQVIDRHGAIFRNTDSAADALAHLLAARRKHGAAITVRHGIEISEKELRRLVSQEGAQG